MGRAEILYAETSRDDVELTLREFKKQGANFSVDIATTGEECLEKLAEKSYDLVLLDYKLPRMDALQILGEVQKTNYDAPVIIVTGRGDEEVAVRAMKRGAYDYVVKSPNYLSRLPQVIQHAIERYRIEREKARLEEELRKREEKLRVLESRFRGTIDSTSDAVIVVDQEEKILIWNPAAEEMFGYRRDEVLGEKFPELIMPPDLKEKGESAFHKAIESGTLTHGGCTIETEGVNREGKRFPLEHTASMWGEGDEIRVVSILRDITGRKEAEEKYSTIVEEGNDWIVIIQDGIIKFANSKTSDVSGYAKDKVIGSSFIEFVSPEYREIAIRRHKKRISGEKVPNSYEIGILSKTGEIIPVEISVSLISYRNKPAEIVIIRDITERKEAEEKLRVYAREIEESNEMKGLFADILHHDLGNPIGIAANFVDLVLEEEDPQKREEDLEKVKKNLCRAEEIMEDAREISKLEGAEKLERKEMDLKELIQSVVASYGSVAEEEGIEIENRITERVEVRAHHSVERVFSNLLSNALKYGKEGKRVILDMGEGEGKVRVKVIDFGKGVPDDYREEIFNRFKRRKKEGIKGTGLGLAIAKRIVELHNGRIWVEDTPNGGATFVVEIPIR